MSYKINKTDGTLLVDLVDGRIDNDTTDVTLIGKNYTGYGEVFNENFVKILENFANVAPPANPLRGQLWYDTSEGRLKVFNGTLFRSTDTTVVSATEPQMLAGDIWIDTARKQIYFSDGLNTILAGPTYTAVQGVTGFESVTYTDRFGNGRVVARLMIGNNPVAIFSNVAFEVPEAIPNFGNSISSGINISSAFSDFEFLGNAQTASSLLDNSGNPFSPDSFLKVSANNTATGTMHVKNDAGLTVGDDSDFRTLVSGTTVIQRVQLAGSNYRLQVRQGSTNVDAISINSTTGRVGIFQTTPQATLDVSGDVRISGDLTVLGTSTTIETANLAVEDKLIEIARTTAGPVGNDSVVDGAGIRVRSSDSNKDWTWSNLYNSWQSSCGIDIATGFAYKIGGNNILTGTALAATVTSAVGLTQIGTLSSLNVDNINLNNATITTTLPLQIISNGEISVNSQKISGVLPPDVSDTPDVVATKGYVDEKYTNQDISLYLDTTGLNNAQIALVLNDLYPAIARDTGVYAYVHCVNYTGSITYNATDGLTKVTVAVDKNGVENQSVIQDFSFNNVTENVALTPTRSLKRFIINGSNQWVFESNLTSSV